MNADAIIFNALTHWDVCSVPESHIPFPVNIGHFCTSRLTADPDPATKRELTEDGRFLQLWLAMLAKCRKLGRIQNHLHQERRGIHAGAAGAEAPWPSFVPFVKKRT